MAEDLRIKLKVMPDTSEVSTKIRALEQSEKLRIKVDPQFDITNIDKQTKQIYSAIANGVNKYAADIMRSIKTVIGTMDLYQGAMADVMTMLKTGNVTQENYTKSLDKYNNVMSQTLALSKTFSMMNRNMQTAQRKDPVYSALRDQETSLSTLKKAAANYKSTVADVQKDMLSLFNSDEGYLEGALDSEGINKLFDGVAESIRDAAKKSGKEIKDTISGDFYQNISEAVSSIQEDFGRLFDAVEDPVAQGADYTKKKGGVYDYLKKIYAGMTGDDTLFQDISRSYGTGGKIIGEAIQKLAKDIKANNDLIATTDDQDALKSYAENLAQDFDMIKALLTGDAEQISAEFDKVMSNIQTRIAERAGNIAHDVVEGSAKQIGEVATGIMKGTLKQAQKEVEDDAEKMKDSVINIATEIQSGLKTAISTPAKTETDYDTGFLMYMSTYKSRIEEFSKSIKSMFSGIDTSKLDDSTRQRVESVLNVMQKLDETMNDIDGNVGKKMNADIYSKFIGNIKNVSVDIDQIISDIKDMTSQNFENVSFGQLTTQDIEAGNELLALMNQIVERQTSLTLAKRGTLQVEQEIIATAKNEKTRLDDMVKEAMSSVKQLEAAQQGVQSNTNSAKSDAEELANAMSKMEVSKLKALLTTITNFVNKLTSDDAKLKDVGGTLQQYKEALDGLKTGVDIYKDAISSLTKYFTEEAVVISAASKTLNDAAVVQNDKSNKDTQKNKAKNKAKTANPVTRAKSYVKDSQAAAEQIIAALDTTDETLGQIVTKLQGVAATGAQLAGSAQSLDKALDQVEDVSKAKIETGKKSTGKGKKKTTSKTKPVEEDKIPTQQDVNKEVSQAAQQFAASIEYVLKQVVAVLEDTSALQAKVDAITTKSDTVQSDKDTIVNAFNELVTVFDSLKAAADSIQSSMAGLLKLQDIADNVNMTDFAKVINDAVQEQLSKITSTTKAATRKAANVTGSKIANQRKTSGSIESMLGLLSDGTTKQGFQTRQAELENEVAAFLSGSEKSAVVWGDIVKKTEILKNDIKQSSDYTKRLVADGADYADAMQALDEYTHYSEAHGNQTSQNLDDKYNDLSYAIAANNDARMAMEQETTTENIVRYTQSCEARTKASSALRAALKAEEKEYNNNQAAIQAATEAQHAAAKQAEEAAHAHEKKITNASNTKNRAENVLSQYDDYASSNTVKTEVQSLANSVTDLLSKARDLRGQMIADPSNIAIAEQYDDVINQLGKSVDSLDSKMQKAKNSTNDSLQNNFAGQLKDKNKTVGALQSLLEGFQKNAGNASGLQSSKDFVSEITSVINAISALSSESDVKEFLSGDMFSNLRTKAEGAGYGMNNLADVVTYLKYSFTNAWYATKKFNDEQKNVDKATNTRKKANDTLGEYNSLPQNVSVNAEMKETAKSIEDLLSKARELRGQMFIDPDNVKLAQEYYDVISELGDATERLSAKMRSAKNKADDSLQNQFTQIPQKLTQIQGFINSFKNNQGEAAGLESSQNYLHLAGEIYDALDTVYNNGDYTKLPEVFQQFASSLRESGVAAKDLAEFMSLVAGATKTATQQAKEFNDAEDMKRNINSWEKSMRNTMYTAQRYFNNNSKISGNTEAYARFVDFFDTYNEMLEKGDITKKNSNQMTKDWADLKKYIQDAGLETDKLSVKLKKLFEVNIKSQLANQVINAFQQGLRQVYQNVVDIDSAMTELKKVTDETSGAYSKFLSEAGDRAKNLGVSISDVVNATADFARLGYNLEEATQISDSAVMFKQVGDGVQSMDDATSDIISAMKAFNIEADKSLTITDRYNAVGNSFSITSAGVAEALKRSASSLHTAGNDIDQSIGMIVAANDVVQDPDSVGAGIRTIALRIRGATTELEAMGEETDTVVKSTAKLQAEIKAIAGVNILEADNSTFKSTYQIMDELADKWSTLTDLQKATLTQDLAGKNRANIFSSMMENWEDARKAMETSKNSAGKQNCLNVQKCA